MKATLEIFKFQSRKQNSISRRLTYFKFNLLESLLLTLFLMSLSITAKDVDLCYKWSEGDAQHLDSCEASSLEKCSKGRKAISQKDTAFQNYKGKIFQNTEDQSIHEFKRGSLEDCEKDIVKSARNSELTMCDNWGKAVYSTGLKLGDKAFIYGKSVNVREKPDSKSKKIFSPNDRTEVQILEKSAAEDKIDKLYSAYWFKISAAGKIGWVYGQFIHPNPTSKTAFIE